MANEQNLIPQAHKLTVEEASRGGKRSGEVRRENATFIATLKKLLDQEYKSTGLTYREMATFGLIKGAVKGNALNYKTMVELLGEDKQGNTNNGVIDELIEVLNNAKNNK